MKCIKIDWKQKQKNIAFAISFYDKHRINDACMDVIDVLRKKHKLSPLQCALALEALRDSLSDTMTELFHDEG